MALNVIDLIRGQLGPALVTQSATKLGESESGISKAISALLPAVVGALADNSDKPGVLESITGSASSGILGNLLDGAAGNSMVATVLQAIFGDKVPGLVNAVSGYAGVSNTSANSLLYTVTGATIGSVGKYAQDQNMDASGVAGLLNEQRGTVASLLPAGLSLASLGVGNLANGDEYPETAKITAETHDAPKVEVNRGGNTHVHVDNNDAHKDNGSVWKWLLPLLLLALAAWFLWKQCDRKTTENTVVTDSVVTDNDSAAIINDTASIGTTSMANRETTTVSLPAGQTLNAYRGGIEDQIVAFLNSEEYKNADETALKERWFNFDNLSFEFNSTKLTPESQTQLDNIKAILAAYPDAKIKIGAYSDKKGDDAANKTLSRQRADAVKSALASAQVISAEGYGEERATVAETASDEEREKDRITAIRFTK
ncbi:OmpA/MotB [Flavobacteriaceae bacterium 3519-10]|nr:OmpA/MotB [Flavobacteriaceae bacterium 3519-10]